MTSRRPGILQTAAIGALLFASFAGCKAAGNEAGGPAKDVSTPPAAVAIQIPGDVPDPGKTGGFDGGKAYVHVAKQVGFGPRPAGSKALEQTQGYLVAELKSYGCPVETDEFKADTPVGQLAMKNILVKIPGDKPGIILLGTHYDTKILANFVGADDGGSSTGVMLELARLLCPQRQKYAVWIAFFDGEEATREWSDSDSRFGSRQMAARFAASGELKNIRAFLLADIVGGKRLHFKRESSSTPALVDLVWSVAKKLGYSEIFLKDEFPVEDDHDSFLKRKVPSVDVIDLDHEDVPYWHTAEDTLDKISPRSLAITGHVFLASLHELQQR
ncbi:MAG TPA: M28 family peptidase [Candidatus Saccharimonadales bacterium]|nr:M28 family peptidase [Candidatus Saccharimonadales bacterium]